MSINILTPEWLTAYSALEGGRARDSIHFPESNPCRVGGCCPICAVRFYNEQTEKRERMSPTEREFDYPWRTIIVYGLHGLHRFFVESDGTVFYSEGHGMAARFKAGNLGFDVR